MCARQRQRRKKPSSQDAAVSPVTVDVCTHDHKSVWSLPLSNGLPDVGQPYILGYVHHPLFGSMFPGYIGDTTLVIDDFSGELDKRQWNIGTLLYLLSGTCLVQTSSRGRVEVAKWKHVIIVSDMSPEQWYPSASRTELAALKAVIKF